MCVYRYVFCMACTQLLVPWEQFMHTRAYAAWPLSQLSEKWKWCEDTDAAYQGIGVPTNAVVHECMFASQRCKPLG